MKKLQIFLYIITLLILSNLATPLRAQQNNKPLTDKEVAESPLHQGTMVGIDIFGLVGKILGNGILNTEASVQVNLKNRFFPVAEFGYGSIDTTDDETDIHYKASAPYFRIGMDYNILYRKPYLPGFFTVGLRYGFSSFEYDVKSPSLTDPTWGNISIPIDYQGVKSNAHWVELVAGLKTEVLKNFYMGFSVRYRARLSITKNENSEPYYIPGFGKGTNNLGITYNLIYKLPF